MSISEMIYVSYFFMIIAALCGTAAVIMFFAYDIRRCWKIVRGKRMDVSSLKTFTARPKKQIAVSVQAEKTEKLALEEGTQPLYLGDDKSTVLLVDRETVPLETVDLIQDITMMDAGEVQPT